MVAMMILFIRPIFAVDSNLLQQAQDEQTQLQQELQTIENQIVQYQTQLQTITGEKNTLQNKIKQLQNQQATLNLQIKATNLQIKELGGQLNTTKSAITEKTAKIQLLQAEMTQFIRAINEYDNYPLLYTTIIEDNLFDAFNNIEQYSQIFASLKDVLEEIQQVKIQLDQQPKHQQTSVYNRPKQICELLF